jgi:hypothetical protein
MSRTVADVGKISTASGSERSYRKGLAPVVTLAIARGTDFPPLQPTEIRCNWCFQRLWMPPIAISGKVPLLFSEIVFSSGAVSHRIN